MLPGGALDIHFIEVNNLIVELIGVNVSQVWIRMIQGLPQSARSVRYKGKKQEGCRAGFKPWPCA